MRWTPVVLSLSFLWMGCGRKAHTTASKSSQIQEEDSLLRLMLGDDTDSAEEPPRPDRAKAYYGSKPIYWRLLHTELDLNLDWDRGEVYGEARLWVTPHFIARDSLILDAKAFTIEAISLEKPRDVQLLTQRYDTLRLHLRLSRPVRAGDTLIVRLRYRAHPNWIDTLLTQSTDFAISSRKGAYFINAKGERPCVPTEFWTQGEPESASAWFPTIDSPNQKTTQRLCITVADSHKTLSNGLLVASERLSNGLRRDCWELRQPHTPYLFALVVGPFEIIKDKWRDKELLYYMEKDWVPHTQAIFGNTPRMIEFFSQILGVPFPWPKYGQVIVREFVSGAMENTTAVIHGDMLFYDKSVALTDDDKEIVIAHELFHHWFGDLVTCESWAQLPLNESFADYSEYLWLEHSRGSDMADNHRRKAQQTYLMEAAQKKVPLIRFEERDPMGMFDAHSYQKGGLTLHLLRNYAGDSAFFTSIRTYLIQNAYQSADIDHLRHAFEKVTGLDWTWFFDQHFRRGDEVRLLITAEAQGDTAQIKILQRGYDEKLGPYRYLLPLEVASREKGVERLPMELVGDTLIKVARRGLLYVDYDPERLFVGSSDRRYPNSWWEALLQAPSYLARVEALSQIASLGYQMHEPQTMQRVLATYEGASVAWQVRVWEALESLYDTVAIQSVIPLAQRAIRSQEAKVRAAAWSWIAALVRQFASPVFGKEETFVPTAPPVLKATFWQPEAEKALQDSSAEVISTALLMLYYADEARAKEAALRFLTHPSEEVFIGAISILMRQKAPEGIQGLLSRQACLAGLEARSTTISLLLQAITLYPDHRETILTALKKIAKYENPWYLRLIAVRGLRRSISLDPTIRPFLKELKKSETHPILRKVYEQEL